MSSIAGVKMIESNSIAINQNEDLGKDDKIHSITIEFTEWTSAGMCGVDYIHSYLENEFRQYMFYDGEIIYQRTNDPDEVCSIVSEFSSHTPPDIRELPEEMVKANKSFIEEYERLENSTMKNIFELAKKHIMPISDAIVCKGDEVPGVPYYRSGPFRDTPRLDCSDLDYFDENQKKSTALWKNSFAQVINDDREDVWNFETSRPIDTEDE